MTQLTNQSPASTYGDLLTCTNAGQGLTPVQTNLQDGLGNDSPILIATTSVNFNRGIGQFQIDGTALISNVVDINSMCQPNPVARGNASITVPSGDTAQRPSVPTPAELRFNTDITDLEFYTGTAWQSISAGGTVTSITGTANQIIVTNPTTTPIISLSSTLTGINSISSSLNLTLNGAVTTINGSAVINLNPTNSVNINGTSLALQNNTSFSMYNAANAFNINFSANLVTQNSFYYWPDAQPTVNNMALVGDTSGVCRLSWRSVQLMQVFIFNTGATSLNANTRYIINTGGTVLLLLSSIQANVGDIVQIVGNTFNWTITQGTGQFIHYLGTTTTLGPSGSLASSSPRTCITLTCITANTEFTVSSVTGTLVVT